MATPFKRAAIFGSQIVLALIVLAVTGLAQAQQSGVPCVVGPPVNPMIFYLAQGPAGACGAGCSEWIRASDV